MPQWLLRGEVKDGQFEQEIYVTFVDASNRRVSMIAPRSLLVDLAGNKWIRVHVLDEDQSRYLIQLPGDVFGAGREVTVNKDLVRSA